MIFERPHFSIIKERIGMVFNGIASHRAANLLLVLSLAAMFPSCNPDYDGRNIRCFEGSFGNSPIADTVYYDFNLFELRPICPVDQARASFPYLEVESRDSVILIRRVESRLENQTYQIEKHENYGLYHILYEKRFGDIRQVRYIWIVTKDFAVALKLQHEHPTRFAYRVSKKWMVSAMAMDRDLTHYYFDLKTGYGHLEDLISKENIENITKVKYSFDADSTRFVKTCHGSNCRTMQKTGSWVYREGEAHKRTLFEHWRSSQFDSWILKE